MSQYLLSFRISEYPFFAMQNGHCRQLSDINKDKCTLIEAFVWRFQPLKTHKMKPNGSIERRSFMPWQRHKIEGILGFQNEKNMVFA